VQVQESLGEYRSRGASVTAIGQGTGDEAAHYAEKWGVDFPILGDPEGAAYTAYGMHRGNWWTVLFRALLTKPIESMGRIFEADLAGAQLAATDVLRLGGVAIVAPDGRLRFLHRAQEPDDIPPESDVYAALDSL